jgi:hypothetical protein
MHPDVPHPRTLLLRQDLARYENGMRGKVARVNDFLATHLAVVFGLAWTVWVFMTVTVAAYWMPAAIQGKIFFFSSGCIQLFALPLLTYIGNKAQKATEAQSEAFHLALTHVATQVDDIRKILDNPPAGNVLSET